MAISVVNAPEASSSVVTITVQITLNGDDLPPEASRLLNDLEALAASQATQATQQMQRGLPGAQPTGSAPNQRPVSGPPQHSPSAQHATQHSGRTLRLVETADNGVEHNAGEYTSGDYSGSAYGRVKRIGPVGVDTPSLYLCTGSRLVLRDGAPVPLTRREYDLFLFLCEHPRRVFSRAQLLRQVWGYDMVGTERTVDVHVRRLRVKLGDASRIIATVRGVGYRLDDDAAVQVVVRED